MALYTITWQLNSLNTEKGKAEQEARILERIKELPYFNHPDLGAVWYVSTSWRPDRLQRFLHSRFEAPDRYWIFELALRAGRPTYAGQAGKEFDEWVESVRFLKEPYNLDRNLRLKGEL